MIRFRLSAALFAALLIPHTIARGQSPPMPSAQTPIAAAPAPERSLMSAGPQAQAAPQTLTIPAGTTIYFVTGGAPVAAPSPIMATGAPSSSSTSTVNVVQPGLIKQAIGTIGERMAALKQPWTRLPGLPAALPAVQASQVQLVTFTPPAPVVTPLPTVFAAPAVAATAPMFQMMSIGAPVAPSKSR
jgi:hypothetical protein